MINQLKAIIEESIEPKDLKHLIKVLADTDRYIQIVPLPVPVKAVFKDEKGAEFESPVMFAALTLAGDVELVNFAPDGFFIAPTVADRNFVEYRLG